MYANLLTKIIRRIHVRPYFGGDYAKKYLYANLLAKIMRRICTCQAIFWRGLCLEMIMRRNTCMTFLQWLYCVKYFPVILESFRANCTKQLARYMDIYCKEIKIFFFIIPQSFRILFVCICSKVNKQKYIYIKIR